MHVTLNFYKLAFALTAIAPLALAQAAPAKVDRQTQTLQFGAMQASIDRTLSSEGEFSERACLHPKGSQPDPQRDCLSQTVRLKGQDLQRVRQVFDSLDSSSSLDEEVRPAPRSVRDLLLVPRP